MTHGITLSLLSASSDFMSAKMEMLPPHPGYQLLASSSTLSQVAAFKASSYCSGIPSETFQLHLQLLYRFGALIAI